VDTPEQRATAFAVLRTHHYLGFNRSVGENIGYQVFDRSNRLLAVAWFGAAAWKVAARDRFIGWTPSQREQGLGWIANNVRFLLLPWVRVDHLASHILGQIGRRISGDWRGKYGHAVALLETFIEEDRFRGTSYLAANWKIVGRTTGRSRQDRQRQLSVAPKLIVLLPLERSWRRQLLSPLFYEPPATVSTDPSILGASLQPASDLPPGVRPGGGPAVRGGSAHDHPGSGISEQGASGLECRLPGFFTQPVAGKGSL
jgi:hypothetical protein